MNNLKYIAYMVLIIIIGFLAYNNFKLNQRVTSGIEKISKIDKDTKISSIIYYDQTIESLKKENNDLYDSIKAYKDKIDYLVTFKYKKKYVIDTVYIDTISNKRSEINTYNYTSEPNDTLDYKLSIGSVKEPNWYALNFKISDKFTLVNKKENNLNQLDIIPSGKGDIDNVEVFRKKSKNRKFLDRLCVGPSINVGYDFIDKDLDVSVGLAITFDLLKK